ncbi:hypothetical protein BpHYR1_042169 [Brachionus plicatilis]|uniref:Uncharacterized protein n=1 Tax=Brachionus plicatilis TaxID=10195 RepID=A0A3M7SFP0_BRAPC|nr:hypothetical protein BpHYR1_042169 [Brachionus plicatilis]
MTDKLARKKRKCISLETKMEIIKNHCDQKITTTTLSKEYRYRTDVAEKLHAIEFGSEMPKIDILSAIYKIKRAWDAGFNGDFLFGDLESECNENDDFKEIWTFEKKLNFEKYAYVSIDSNLPARGSLLDIEIINSISNDENKDDKDFSNVVSFLFNTENIVLEKCKTKQSRVEIPNNFDNHNIAYNTPCFLSHIWGSKREISPFLQAFIYKTYCLSQFTYGLETLTLNKSTRNYLNISQNNLIRQILVLKPRCHMTSVLNALQLFNFDQLYVFSKLSFISTIKFNRMASVIYQDLCLNKPTMENKLKSFNQDIVLLESHFTSEISFINSNVEALKKDLKLQFKQENGLTDSVKLCLKNINDNNQLVVPVEQISVINIFFMDKMLRID